MTLSEADNRLLNERLESYKKNPADVKSWDQFKAEWLQIMKRNKTVKKLKKK